MLGREREGMQWFPPPVTETVNSRLSIGKLYALRIAAKLVETAILRICVQRDTK